MARTIRGRGRGRGRGNTGVGPSSTIQHSQLPSHNGQRLQDENESLDDSTQPPNVVFETEFPDQRVDPGSPIGAVSMGKKRGRGPAKSTLFDKLRKVGPIPLLIKDGDTKVSCESASIFAGRVSWIVKHHADMSYPRWNDVPEVEQEELCSRVKADFIISWEKPNHCKTVLNQLRKRFNAFHYQLHKLYLGYGSKNEALNNCPSLVTEEIWRELCNRWGSEEFKMLSEQNKANRKQQQTNHTAGRKSFVRLLEEKRDSIRNLVDFFKESRWSRKKNGFVTNMTEDLYNQMVDKLNEMEPENRTKEAAAEVFKEVLGHRSGYARGLGEMVMLNASSSGQCGENADNASHDSQFYKDRYEELRSNVQEILVKQAEFDKFMTHSISQQQSQGESPRETQGAA